MIDQSEVSVLEILEPACLTVAGYLATYYPDNPRFRSEANGGTLEATIQTFFRDREDRLGLWLTRLEDPHQHADEIAFWFGMPDESLLGLLVSYLRDRADLSLAPCPVGVPYIPDCLAGNQLLEYDRTYYAVHAVGCPICFGQLEYALYREFIDIFLSYTWELEMSSDSLDVAAMTILYNQAVASGDAAFLDQITAPIRQTAEEHGLVIAQPLPAELVMELLALRMRLIWKQGSSILVCF